jgi:tRNA(Arg) A34 adenosine deaminase TadA
MDLSPSEHAVFMKEAIQESLLATKVDRCMPFGAVLVDNTTKKIVLRARNGIPRSSTRGGDSSSNLDSIPRYQDMTRHAETELVRLMTTIPVKENEEGSDATTFTVYTSTEPCVMCAGAIYWQRSITRIVYGCSAASLASAISDPSGFDIAIRDLYSYRGEKNQRRSIDIVGPLLEEEALQAHRDSGVWGLVNNVPGKESVLDCSHSYLTAAAQDDVAVEASLKLSGLGSADVVNDGVVPV